MQIEDDTGAVFEELARQQGKNRFETPKGPGNVVCWVKPPAASTKKTPASNVGDEVMNQKYM